MNLKTRFFRHYKNKPYRYLGLVRHSETLEEMALYECLYKNDLGTMWVRPKEMFFEDVIIEGVQQPRFKSIPFSYKTFEKIEKKQITEIEQISNKCFKIPFDEKKFLIKLEKHSQFFLLIAYDGDQAIGFKLGFTKSKERFYSWIGGVLPNFQGLGIAGELMRQQHEWCRQKNFKIIETRTQNQFAQMLSLNLANGFQITGTDSQSDKPLKIILEKIL